MDVPIAANVLGTLGAVSRSQPSVKRLRTDQKQVCWSIQVGDPTNEHTKPLLTDFDVAHTSDHYQLPAPQCNGFATIDDDAMGMGRCTLGRV
jgi:hypothetical protein